jgi:hypothetical protein
MRTLRGILGDSPILNFNLESAKVPRKQLHGRWDAQVHFLSGEARWLQMF